MPPLEFGWFLPTAGDTDRFAEGALSVPASPEMFERVTLAADRAGLEYLLVPVQTLCWEAWITSAMMIGRTERIKPLVAARPGYINPTLLAKMIAAFDRLSGGRVCINLIAGASETEAAADGLELRKEDRYRLMDETVTMMKRLWTEEGAVTFEGELARCAGARCVPKPLQQPHPPFYLGGGSQQAAEISAKHSNVHLFWGDRPERIESQIEEIRQLADRHGRADEIGFGMRLQIICRESEEEAWQAARLLIEGASDRWKEMISRQWSSSEANRRMRELAEAESELLGPHLWTGLTKVRQGAGVAVVGNPRQVASTLQEFIDAGCHSFCLGGYPHDTEAERFGREVLPLFSS